MKRVILMVLAWGILAMGAGGCSPLKQGPEWGLFSWKSGEVSQPAGLWQLCKKAGVTQVYQSFSSKLTEQEAQAFLQEAASNKIEVYFLTGSPEWGLDPLAEHLLEQVESAAALNRAGEGKLRGVVLDVEPYLTDAWDEDPDTTMDTYVSAMELAYEAARKEKLRCIVCIPYFYDTKGQEAGLERLISSCCDAVAVMNYQKADEAGQLARETELAERYGKELIQIYELQEPGDHGLTERNTYHGDGLEAVERSRASLLERYPGLSFAYHDYPSLRALVEEESPNE